MTDQIHLDPELRHDFVLLYDVEAGNPNGDPDNANHPRTDPETGHLWVSDVAIKRKIRDFIADAYQGEPGMGIYVQHGTALNEHHRIASEAIGLEPDKKRSASDQSKAAEALKAGFYDIRAFGAVLSTGDHPAGQVRGPIQLACPAVSIEPHLASELTITRFTATKEDDLAAGKDREMGSKYTVPYALIKAKGTFTPSFARQAGFTSDDLAVFWDALQRMWALDRSASRGITGSAGIHIFSHPDAYGRARAATLHQLVRVERTSDGPARRLEDYTVSVDTAALPEGITHTLLAG